MELAKQVVDKIASSPDINVAERTLLLQLLKKDASFVTKPLESFRKTCDEQAFIKSLLICAKAAGCDKGEKMEPSSQSGPSPPEAFRDWLTSKLAKDDYGVNSDPEVDFEQLKNIKFILDEVLYHHRIINSIELRSQFLSTIGKFYRDLKAKFLKINSNIMNLTTEEFSYFSLYLVIKNIVKSLLNVDEFSFLLRSEKSWEQYSSYNDKHSKITDNETISMLDNEFLDKDNKTKIIEEDSSNELNALINNRKFRRIYVLKFRSKMGNCIISYNLTKSSCDIDETFLSHFTNPNIYFIMTELSNYIIEILHGVKFNSLTLSETIENTLHLRQLCLIHGSILIKEELKDKLAKFFKLEIISENNSMDDLENVRRLSKRLSCEPSMKTASEFRIWFIGSKISLLIRSFDHKKSVVESSFHSACAFYFKFISFMRHQLQKTYVYKYFIFNEKRILMDFNKSGDLFFMSRMPSHNFLQENKINLKSTTKKNILDIFSENSKLLETVQKIIIDKNELGTLHKYRTSDKPVAFEILPVRNEKNYKGLYLILNMPKDDFKEWKITSPSKNMQQPDIQKMERKNLKALFKNKIKAIKTMITATSLTKTLNFLKTEQGQGTYVEEFLPTGLRNNLLLQRKTMSIPSNLRNRIISFYKKHKSMPRSESLQVSPKNEIVSIKPEKEIFKVEENDRSLIDSFSFNVFELKTVGDKHRIVWALFERLDFITTVGINLDTLAEFLHEAEGHYGKFKNPFHNYDHAISVAQSCYTFITKTKVSGLLKELESFCLIFSGYCHDMAHTGRTNMFEMNSFSKLAIRYHDKSVLEQHHAAVTFKILRHENANIFSNCSTDTFKEIRKLVISNILHTDMKEHFSLLGSFELLIKNMTEKENLFDKIEDRFLLSGMLIHCADFNGAAKEFAVSKIWSKKVNMEFARQYRLEEKEGLPLTPYMKDLDKMSVMAKCEMGFLKVIVQPLWALINGFLDNKVEESVINLNNNILEWEKIFKSYEDGTNTDITEEL